eukprot:c6595_g1_i2.p1 GENE.c6595_g1_i2~~c6595_g1_i2.p1  ORF type:complete len:154 (+),score=24.68 c6595_g1_i2:1-462(+)
MQHPGKSMYLSRALRSLCSILFLNLQTEDELKSLMLRPEVRSVHEGVVAPIPKISSEPSCCYAIAEVECRAGEKANLFSFVEKKALSLGKGCLWASAFSPLDSNIVTLVTVYRSYDDIRAGKANSTAFLKEAAKFTAAPINLEVHDKGLIFFR